MKNLSLSFLFLTLLPSAFADTASGDLGLKLEGRTHYCETASDTFGAANAYQLVNPEMKIRNGVLSITTQFIFLRCSLIGGQAVWQSQNIFAPSNYSMPGEGKDLQVSVTYSLPEILLLKGENTLLNSTPILGRANSESVTVSAALADLLTTAQKRALERDGVVDFRTDLQLRLRSAVSADGEEPVNMGERAWNAYVLLGRITRDASGKLGVTVIR